MKKYLTLLMIVFIHGCTVGPDFVRPDPPKSEKYTHEKNLEKFGSQQVKYNKSIPQKWWQEFGNAELNSVVEFGLKNSHTLSALQKSRDQAEELLIAEKAYLFPLLSLEADAGRQKYGASFLGQDSQFIPPFTYYQIGPSLTYLLDIFGSTRRAIEAQKALAEYQLHAYNAAYLSLSAKIASTVLTIAIINSELEVAKEIIREDKQNLELVKKSFKIGSATQNHVLAAQNQLITDEALLPRFEFELTRAKNELNVLVGKTPVEWTPPHFNLKNFRLPKELPLSLPSKFVRSRPDILAAESVLHAASANIGVATANLYPNIVITGTFLQEAITPEKLFLASSSAWSYLGSLTTPIFNAGLLQAQKRAAMRAYEASFSNYQDIVVKSFVQVNDALHSLKVDQEADELGRQSVATAKASFLLAQKSQQVGGMGTLGLLNAERHYMQTRLAYTRIKGQRYQDVVQFYLALGGTPTDSAQ